MIKLSNKNIFGIIGSCALLLTACLSVSSIDSEKVRKEVALIPSVTMTPEVPDAVKFCGENIDLTRYNRHEGFDRELSSFCYFHSSTMLMIKRANRYFPIIEPVLKANGVPDDFKYLAVIESHLDPRALSPAKAMGTWQLLEGTAKQYGLAVTPTVDERSDVEKSTAAACRYLKAAYNKYGHWPTVAASYNAGQGRISGELEKQYQDDTFDLWLNEETSRYVYRILAMKQIFESPSRYGFIMRPADLYKPIDSERFRVTQDIPDLADFARQRDITYADLKRFNPWLRDRKLETGGKSYILMIPKKEDLYYNTPNSYVHNPGWIVK